MYPSDEGPFLHKPRRLNILIFGLYWMILLTNWQNIMIRLPCQMHTSFPCVHFGSPTSWFTLITLCSAPSANENEACYQTLVCQSSRWNQSCSRGSCKLVVYLDRFGFDNYLFCHLSSSNNVLCNSRTVQLFLYKPKRADWPSQMWKHSCASFSQMMMKALVMIQELQQHRLIQRSHGSKNSNSIRTQLMSCLTGP